MIKPHSSTDERVSKPEKDHIIKPHSGLDTVNKVFVNGHPPLAPPQVPPTPPS